jgi:predicted nucleic acid-binding protein
MAQSAEAAIIGTFCIEMGAELLTADRHFEPMRDHLGLRLFT